jgi:regulator of sigma E protease
MLGFIGYFIIILLIFGILVLVHELGHFLTARLCGVTVNEFAIGMGPKIFTRVSKKSGIRYSVRLLPIGGFVSMKDDDVFDGEVDPNDDGSFCNKSVPRRMLITIAGAVMNLILGFLLMMILVFSTQNLASTTVAKFAEDATSSQWLHVDDEIIKVGKTRVHTFNEVAYEIMNSGYEPVDITVKRNGEKIVLHGVVFSTFEESGTVFGQYDFIPYAEETNFPNLIKHTFFRSVSTVKMVLDSVKGLLTGRFGMEAVSGPVGVVTVVEDAAKMGFASFLYVVCVLTINLGVFNLIPFPALDGGQFLFLAIEGVRGKPINRNIQSYINFAGIVILFAFMIFITCKDVINLIFK